jgi:hypothetical protein
LAVEPIDFLRTRSAAISGVIMRSHSSVSTRLSRALRSTARALSLLLPSTWLVQA